MSEDKDSPFGWFGPFMADEGDNSDATTLDYVLDINMPDTTLPSTGSIGIGSHNWISSSTFTGNVDTSIDNMVVTEKLTVQGIDIGASLKIIQERLLIINENFEKHEKYPALKDAYEKYKLIETLINEQPKDE